MTAQDASKQPKRGLFKGGEVPTGSLEGCGGRHGIVGKSLVRLDDTRSPMMQRATAMTVVGTRTK